MPVSHLPILQTVVGAILKAVLGRRIASGGGMMSIIEIYRQSPTLNAVTAG